MKTTVLSMVGFSVILWGSPREATPAEPSRVLDNGRMTLTLDPAQRGAITSLVSDGCQWIATQRAPRLFLLEFSPAANLMAKRIWVSSRDMASCKITQDTQGTTTTARVECSGFSGQPIEVVCTIAATQGDPLVRFRIDVRFPKTLVLESVQFPMLVLRTPLGDGQSDAVVVGATKGGVYGRPWTYKPGQGIRRTQPGSLAAAMACYGNDDVGLLSALFDARGHRKTVGVVRTAEGLELAWTHPAMAKSQFTLAYDAVLASYGRRELGRRVDWRDGADLYKAWAIRQPWCAKTLAQRDDLPDWYKQAPAMVRFSRDWLAKPELIERWLHDYWQGNFRGVPLIVAYWGWEKLGDWITPEYFPCYPSDEAFTRLVKLGRGMDAHAFLWPSGYHYTVTYDKKADGAFQWDDRERFDKEARAHAVCGRDGKAIVGDRFWLRGGQTACMCPGDRWTLDWFNRISTEIAKRGVDLIQVDQVVGGSFPVCYSSSHGHEPGPGLWMGDVVREQLKTMAAQCRAIDPGTILGVEEPNEWFIQQVGIQDYRDLESLKDLVTEPASVFGYLYHEYLPLFQSNPMRGNLPSSAYCLVNGQIPHFIPWKRSPSGLLLQDGDFEDSEQGRLARGWDIVHGYQGKVFSGEATSDAAQHHTGSRSLRLRNIERGQIVQVAQNLPVVQKASAPDGLHVGATYRMSAWMKSEGLQGSGGVHFGTFAAGLKSTGGWSIPAPRVAGDWTEGRVEFKAPPGSEMLRIMLQINGPGAVWIDDLRLEEVRPDGTAVPVQQPKFPPDHELMHQWVELFHGAGRPYLFLGKMVHPPELKTAAVDLLGRKMPAVLHNAFQAPDQSVAAVLVNATDTPQTAVLSWSAKDAGVSLTLQPWQSQLVPKPK